MRARALILGLILPAAVLLTSCTKREDVTIAKYADKEITVGEFEKAYAVVNPEYLPKAKGVEGHKEFVTTMINKGVMAYKADELGYDYIWLAEHRFTLFIGPADARFRLEQDII